jgi:hypothetical protein
VRANSVNPTFTREKIAKAVRNPKRALGFLLGRMGEKEK